MAVIKLFLLIVNMSKEKESLLWYKQYQLFFKQNKKIIFIIKNQSLSQSVCYWSSSSPPLHVWHQLNMIDIQTIFIKMRIIIF